MTLENAIAEIRQTSTGIRLYMNRLRDGLNDLEVALAEAVGDLPQTPSCLHCKVTLPSKRTSPGPVQPCYVCGHYGYEFKQETPEPMVAEESPVTELTLWCDGGTRLGNPGPGYGSYAIETEPGIFTGRVTQDFGQEMTNNAAEYVTLKVGLESVLSWWDGDYVSLTIRTDSQLIEGHIQGIPPGKLWKVNAKHLEPLIKDVRQLLSRFASWEIQHTPREDIVAVLGH